VVSDLRAVDLSRNAARAELPGRPLSLPPEFPEAWMPLFPWNEPIVFRSGRFVVQRVEKQMSPLFPQK
jgi:hypothetical protein